MAQSQAWGDKRFEVMMGRLLRFGVIFAAAWVLAGGIHYLVQFGGATPDYKVFRGEPGGLRHPREIIHEAIHLDARGLIQLLSLIHISRISQLDESSSLLLSFVRIACRSQTLRYRLKFVELVRRTRDPHLVNGQAVGPFVRHEQPV